MEDDRQIPLQPLMRKMKRTHYGEVLSETNRRSRFLSARDFAFGDRTTDGTIPNTSPSPIQDDDDDSAITDTELEEKDEDYANAIAIRHDALTNETLRTIRKLGPMWTYHRNSTIFMGIVLLLLVVFLIIAGLPGLFNFIPRVFFVDFGSIISLPVVLQFPLPLFVHKSTSKLLRVIIFAYSIFCLVLDVFQFISALYSTVYSTYSTGTVWYSVGIFVADALTLLVLIFGIIYAAMAGLLYADRAPPIDGGKLYGVDIDR